MSIHFMESIPSSLLSIAEPSRRIGVEILFRHGDGILSVNVGRIVLKIES